MSKHTPGPWIYDEAASEIGAETDNGAMTTIATMTDWFPEYYQERYANARLIAAAPDLLEALQEIAAPACMAMNSADRVEAFRDIARAAISKATGIPTPTGK